MLLYEEEELGDYFSIKAYPPRTSKDPIPWIFKDSGGFQELDWSPYTEKVRGSYWVEVDADLQNFTVYGVIDVDGDGVFQTYYATKDTETQKK